MRQKKYPCCGEPMSDTDLFALINDGGSSCPTINCEHCGKELTVYLNVYSVEVVE